jgi:dienelactone hydrolase
VLREHRTRKTEIDRRAFLARSAVGAAALLAVGEQVPPALAEEKSMSKVDLAKELLRCLGGPWPEPCDLRPTVADVMQKDGYRIESLSYEAEPGDRIPALLMVPDGIDAQHPAPAVAVWHQHNGQWQLGKSEPAGLAGNPMHQTGLALVREGYVVLCPDALCFEGRQDSQLKREGYERFEFLRYVVAGKCMAWKNILDMRRAIDYLCARPEVQHERIGCYGHSMGSTHTWLVGPWEPRLKCLVGNCCLPTYAAIQRTKLLHCFSNFIPGWSQYGDTPDIAGLIAPRALHLNFGEKDHGSPIEEVRQGIKTITAAYEAAHASENFSSYIEEGGGHVLSPEMWRRTREWFKRHLSG